MPPSPAGADALAANRKAGAAASATPAFPRLPAFDSLGELLGHARRIGAELPALDPFDPEPLGRPVTVLGRTLANRFCLQPMEGWDGGADGTPSELTERRWRRFGGSGAGLVWGGEAVAVRPDGRANPNQLCLTARTQGGIARLLETLRRACTESGATQPLVGLQLTHSGRYCRPQVKDRLEPRIAYHHPLLDRRVGVEPEDAAAVLSDGELDDLQGDFAVAARRAAECGFEFVDIKHCHGYLLHELLSARSRPGRYGGDFSGRTRFLREVVAAVRREVPGLGLGVRLSAFDLLPFRAGPGGVGEPEPWDGPYPFAFGVDSACPTRADLGETHLLLRLLGELGVALVNLTAGSPYYNPHIQRPAQYPPSDGYLPPEDPLLGVSRLLGAARDLRPSAGRLLVVGSGYSYLQEFLPPVAAGAVAAGWTDCVGLGRLTLSYPDFAATVLGGGVVERRRLCRTFSDCTTGPRRGLVSGCYPLDEHYRASEGWARLQAWKKGEGR